MRRNPNDPTRVTEQSSLTTSRGRSWLVAGGLLGAVAVAVLIVITPIAPGIALTGCALVVALYAAMLIVRFTVGGKRSRLVALAWLMAAMAVVALVAIVMVGAAARSGR